MDWTVTIAAVLVAWSALRVLGNERQRLLEEIVARTPPATAPTPAPTDPHAGVPVVS